MKKRKVPHLDLLVSQFGENRLLEILQNEQSLTDEIDDLANTVSPWYYHFNLHTTALVLSYAIDKPHTAFLILLVCKLWYKAFNTKLFWTKYFERKFANIPADLKSIFTPFHPLVWPKHKYLIIASKQTCHDDEKYAKLSFTFNNHLHMEFYTWKEMSDNYIAIGVFSQMHQACDKRLLKNAHVIYNGNDFTQTSQGLYCIQCACLVDADVRNQTWDLSADNDIHINLSGKANKIIMYQFEGTAIIRGKKIVGKFLVDESFNDCYLQKVNVEGKEIDTGSNAFYRKFAISFSS